MITNECEKEELRDCWFDVVMLVLEESLLDLRKLG